jgi:uncharacterized protein DUF6876
MDRFVTTPMKTKLSAAELQAGLSQFYGTENYYRHMGKLVVTDGTKFLADQAGCYWLCDIVFSVLPKLSGEGFAAMKLTVNLAKKEGWSSSRTATTASCTARSSPTPISRSGRSCCSSRTGT